jgi:antitoxin HicB
MSDNFKYPVKLTPDDNNTFYVTFPDFPEAITFGENVEDAIFHAQNALDEVMHFYMSEKSCFIRK